MPGNGDRERRTVLALIAVLAGVVVGLVTVGPLFYGDGLHALFGLACHQNPERCLLVAGAPMALCVRCLGLFIGFGAGAIGALVHPFERRGALRILFLAAALTALDVLAERLGLYHNLIPLRMATGLFLGAAITLMIGHRAETGHISALSRQPQNPQKT